MSRIVSRLWVEVSGQKVLGQKVLGQKISGQKISGQKASAANSMVVALPVWMRAR
jgi:hypothetical protein